MEDGSAAAARRRPAAPGVRALEPDARARPHGPATERSCCGRHEQAVARIGAAIADARETLLRQADLIRSLEAAQAGIVASCVPEEDAAGVPAAAAAWGIASAQRLTGREHQVLVLLGAGITNRGIARHLDISDRTVRNHVHAIFGKLGVHSRTEAALVAVRNGLLRP
ncbi:response regulator transcription factor [Spirillospora sp. NPDC049652]